MTKCHTTFLIRDLSCQAKASDPKQLLESCHSCLRVPPPPDPCTASELYQEAASLLSDLPHFSQPLT